MSELAQKSMAYTLLLILTHDERNVLKCSELISNNNKAVLYQIRKLTINRMDLEKLYISIVIATDAQREMSVSLPVCPFFHFLSVVCIRTLQHYIAVSWHVLSNGLYPFCIQNVIAWNHLCPVTSRVGSGASELLLDRMGFCN